jgi:hypothetical protein
MDKHKKDSFRGNNLYDVFFENFKNSVFYTGLYKKHKDELIIGVRDGYINIYYNCDSIARIENSKKEYQDFVAEIGSYYLTGESPNKKYIKISGQEMLDNYEVIKSNSNKRRKLEKQAQERLFIDNNMNVNSKWFCIDVEYTKSFEDWRFDIIAISKQAPFRIALIELKYGSNAIGGKSGITEHIQDFYKFHKNNCFEKLKPELKSIIDSLIKLGVDVPETLHDIKIDNFAKTPEYYYITLNNNKEVEQNASPMETMAGYLFTKANGDWKAVKYSKNASRSGYYAVVGEDKSFQPVFLFSNAILPNLGINDILDESNYIKKIIEQ